MRRTTPRLFRPTRVERRLDPWPRPITRRGVDRRCWHKPQHGSLNQTIEEFVSSRLLDTVFFALKSRSGVKRGVLRHPRHADHRRALPPAATTAGEPAPLVAKRTPIRKTRRNTPGRPSRLNATLKRPGHKAGDGFVDNREHGEDFGPGGLDTEPELKNPRVGERSVAKKRKVTAFRSWGRSSMRSWE